MAVEHSYFGETVRQTTFGGICATESRYHSGQSAPMHAHDLATLCFVLNGAFEERTESDVLSCRRGSVLFRPAGRPHSDRFLGSKTVTFGLDLSADVARFGPAESTLVTRPRATGFLRHLYVEACSPDPFSSLIIESLVYSLEDLIAGIPSQEGPRPPAWLTRTHSRLLEESGKIPSVQDLAKEAGVHPVYLNRCYRKFYGTSVGQTLRRARLERCLTILEDDAVDLGAVAAEVGYCDQAHFTRSFRLATGRTPGEYRAKKRSGRL